MSFLQGLHAGLSPRSQIYEGYCEGSGLEMMVLPELLIVAFPPKPICQAVHAIHCNKTCVISKDTCQDNAKLCSLLHRSLIVNVRRSMLDTSNMTWFYKVANKKLTLS